MKSILFYCVLLILVFQQRIVAQPVDYRIYGQISTVDNQELTGYIEWGANQLYWIDIFKANKPSNPYTHYFNPSDGLLFQNNGQASPVPPTHIFACRFGNIKTIELTAPNQIELQIKDGNSIKLNRGSFSDIGSPVQIYTTTGTIKLKWEKISKIEFSTPDSLTSDPLALPITGIVKTDQGFYKGFITWDKDEKTLSGTLDGQTQKGNRSIPFGKINKIIKQNNACRVILQNGEEWDLWGTNDVNNQNRGIIINMPGIGSVTVPWDKFEIFEARSIEDIKTLSYTDFGTPKRLYGEVTARKGQKIKGTMAYDLDEAMNFELLEGQNDNIYYEIPFRNLRSIEPKNYKYSFITLSNNGTLSLGDSVDVDYENSGILIFPENTSPVYIPWKEVTSIVFEP